MHDFPEVDAEVAASTCTTVADDPSTSFGVASAPDHSRDRRTDRGLRAPASHRVNFGGRSEAPWHHANVFDARDPLAKPVVGSHLLQDARVLIVDDCTLYREYLADVISAHGATFTGVAWDLSSLVDAYEDILPRVILINMATRDSAVLLRQALMIGPSVRVVVVGVSEDDDAAIVACAEAGVAGYHMRTDSLTELIHLVRRVVDGESLFSSKISAILMRRLSALAAERPVSDKELVLTSREAQILSMLELGLSNREIAGELHIAVHTVKNHVHSLLNKLGVGTRAQAAALSRTIHYRDGDQRD